MAKRRKVGNMLALGLLSLLAAGLPMHPYEMATMLKRTGKDKDFKIKWGSLYTVVQNLEKHGFIEETGTDRAGRRPERTVYGITEAGREELRDWVRELVGELGDEQSTFAAALSVAGILPPHEVADLLDKRLAALDADIAAQRAVLDEASTHVARIFLIEVEFAIAMREAEAAWVRGLRTELVEGTLPGIAEWAEYHETGRPNPEWERLVKEASDT